MSRTIWKKIHLSGQAVLYFSNFSCMFQNPNNFFNLNSNCSNILDRINLQEQVKKLFWPFTVWTNCFSGLNVFANSRPSASNVKSFFRSLEQIFLTVGKDNFSNKIPFPKMLFLSTKNFWSTQHSFTNQTSI